MCVCVRVCVCVYVCVVKGYGWGEDEGLMWIIYKSLVQVHDAISGL